MSFVQAILMAIIQGLTEFLPVSSSGHLALFKLLLDVETDTGILYDVLLHVGTLLAICIFYYKDIFRLITEGWGIIRDAFVNVVIFFRNKLMKKSEDYRHIICNGYRKFAMLVMVATIPTAVVGFFGREVVMMAAEMSIVPGICLIVNGIFLLIADHIKDGNKLPKGATYTDAFAVGIVQGIATLPGLSRSGLTITASLICGFQRRFAVKYSFIMSIPAILGALVLELMNLGEITVTTTEMIYFVVGMLIAAIIGFASIKLMLVVVRRKKFTFFAVYCLLVGVVSIGGYFYML